MLPTIESFQRQPVGSAAWYDMPLRTAVSFLMGRPGANQGLPGAPMTTWSQPRMNDEMLQTMRFMVGAARRLEAQVTVFASSLVEAGAVK